MKKLIIVLVIALLIITFGSCQSENVVDVNYIASDGGIIAGETNQSIKSSGEEIEFSEVTAVANDGYVFVGWNDGYNQPTRKDKLSNSASFIAKFEKKSIVTIEYKAQEGGTISGTAIQTAENVIQTTQVVAIPNEGYRFIKWDDGLTSRARNDESDESKTFTALFERVYTIEFTCDSNMGEISGRLKQKIYEGRSCAQVNAIPKVGYRFVGWSTGEKTKELKITPNEDMVVTAIFEMDMADLPVITIKTENSEPILSKESYLNCVVEVLNSNHPISSEEAKIRGRGNTSWDSPKKPYRLKFENEIDLFGNGSARTWTLIANYTDLSLIRNYLAYSVASIFDSQGYTTDMQFVEFYVNNEYLGVYLVCEQIEVHPNRINIDSSDEIDTGYLIELDSRRDGKGFYLNDEYYVIKSPDTDDGLFTDEHTTFIKGYLEACLEALANDDYKRIEELIDTRSFAQAYIVFELFKCVDVGYASFYMHKDTGGKLRCGPVWDFDRSLGITGHNKDAEDYASLWAKNENAWFNMLLSHSEFTSLVVNEIENNYQQIQDKLDSCYSYVYANEVSFLRNFEKWNILGTYVWPNSGETGNLKSWKEQVEYTRQYLLNSLSYLKSIYK